MSDLPELLVNSQAAYMISPAGTGKTWTIIEALKRCSTRQLVLTHTYAGVAALRHAAERAGIASDRAHIDTIASWMLRLVSAYPSLSGIDAMMLDKARQGAQPVDWNSLSCAAVALFANRNIGAIVRNSYGGMFVDEYQDCTKTQHASICALKAYLPIRLLGDPLQGIFAFTKEPIHFESDVAPHFSRIEHLPSPRRWMKDGGNHVLGNWLLHIRSVLESGQSLDLSGSPVSIVGPSQETLASVARRISGNTDESTMVVVATKRSEAEIFARQLDGFATLEELEANDWRTAARAMDSAASSDKRAYRFGEAIKKCIKVRAQAGQQQTSGISTIVNLPPKRNTPTGIERARNTFMEFARSGEPKDAARVMGYLENDLSVQIIRSDMWNEMRRTLAAMVRSPKASYAETAWRTRQNTKFQGRVVPPRVCSTTLLLKGLECDHVIIPDITQFGGDRQQIYVALSRARKSVTVIAAHSNVPLKPR